MFLKFLLLMTVCSLVRASSIANVFTGLENDSKACYDFLGCFDNRSPFWNIRYRPISFLPQSPAKINTTFILFTGDDTAGTYIPATDPSSMNTSIRSSDFKAERATKLIVHGWIEWGDTPHYLAMKEALLKEGDYNVFLVDWQDGAKQLYGQATANTRVVGAQIALLISVLQEERRTKPEDIHIIGHSLGAHVAGYAGEREFLDSAESQVRLDPAEPYFQYMDPVVRLDPTDAAFVDVIHTDAAPFFSLRHGLGMSQPCGHMDFYVNGGHEQPGCPASIGDIFQRIKDGEPSDIVLCKHQRSIHLFTDTINRGQCYFKAYQCASEADFDSGKCIPCTGSGCGIMGFHADDVIPPNNVTNVKYYLNTGVEAPFCRFHYKVTLNVAAGKGEKQRGDLYVQLLGSHSATPMVKVTKEPVYIHPGSSHSFIVTSPEELGFVGKVGFRWVQKASFLDPDTWCILSTPSLYLNGIDVYGGETQRGASVCASGAKVDSKSEILVEKMC